MGGRPRSFKPLGGTAHSRVLTGVPGKLNYVMRNLLVDPFRPGETLGQVWLTGLENSPSYGLENFDLSSWAERPACAGGSQAVHELR